MITIESNFKEIFLDCLDSRVEEMNEFSDKVFSCNISSSININSGFHKDLKDAFKLSDNDEIYLCLVNDKSEGIIFIDKFNHLFVLTENGFGFELMKDNYLVNRDFFYWEEIEKIDWNPSGVIFFTLEDGDVFNCDLGLEKFGYLNSDSFLFDMIDTIHNQFKIENEKIYNKRSEIYTEIEDLLAEGQFETVLQKIDQISFFNENYLNRTRSKCYLGLGNYNLALKVINKNIEDNNQEENSQNYLDLLIKGDINQELGLPYRAFIEYLNCKEFYEKKEEFDEQLISEIDEKIFKSYKLYSNTFFELKYNERKVLYINDSLDAIDSKNFKTLFIESLPKGIQFPVGHPKERSLYVAHPNLSNSYLCLKDYENSLFRDRIDEFMSFLQCLGAKKIEYEVVKGGSLNSSERISTSIEAKVDVKIHSGEFKSMKDSSNEAQEETNFKIEKVQEFSPTKGPHLPENMIWYPTELSWQRLYEQRIQGNIDKHSEIVSSSEQKLVSESELRNIKADLRIAFVKVGAEWNEDTESSLSSSETNVWNVFVEFAPKRDLKKNKKFWDFFKF